MSFWRCAHRRKHRSKPFELSAATAFGCAEPIGEAEASALPLASEPCRLLGAVL
jgi:hypothetical protein